MPLKESTPVASATCGNALVACFAKYPNNDTSVLLGTFLKSGSIIAAVSLITPAPTVYVFIALANVL